MTSGTILLRRDDVQALLSPQLCIAAVEEAFRKAALGAVPRPGTFIAAVGADNEDKQEIAPELMARARVVTDLTAQAARIGDLHHAIDAGLMSAGDVHAELGEIVSGLKPAPEAGQEITIFDSTGTGLQDVAAAIAVYRRALEAGPGLSARVIRSHAQARP